MRLAPYCGSAMPMAMHCLFPECHTWLFYIQVQRCSIYIYIYSTLPCHGNGHLLAVLGYGHGMAINSACVTLPIWPCVGDSTIACRCPCCACSLHKAMHSAMGVTCLRIVSALQWPLHPKPFLLFIAIPSRSHGRVCQSRLPSALQHRAFSLLLMVPTQP